MILKETYVRKEGERINYLLYVPNNFKEGLPMITFLHGAGERGVRLEHLYRWGLPKFIKEGREYEALILIPQCHENFVWNNLVEELHSVITAVADKYQADKARLSITGGSMGGFGSWEMGMTYPEMFSAIAPICGGGLSWRAARLSKIPVYAYHGEADSVVPLEYSRLMVNACGKNAILTVFEGMEHCEAIDEAYINTDLMDKLINTRKADFSRVPEVCEEAF